MKRILITLIGLLLFSSLVVAQKRVHVREYRRKDGTVVKAHDRRAPKSQSPAPSSTSTKPLVDFRDQKFEPSPLDELSRLVLEPYEVVDLGDGSTFTPNGTGTVRPRRVVPRVPGKLTPREAAYRNILQWEVAEAARRFSAANSLLQSFLTTPPNKQTSDYLTVVERQRAEVKHYADAFEVARRELLAFEQVLSDLTTRKMFRNNR